jgi:hypothetical protein
VCHTGYHGQVRIGRHKGTGVGAQSSRLKVRGGGMKPVYRSESPRYQNSTTACEAIRAAGSGGSEVITLYRRVSLTWLLNGSVLYTPPKLRCGVISGGWISN